MNNHHFNNPGTSKPTVRSRGPGSTSYGYPYRFPMNAAIASTGLINNGFVGGYNNGFPMENGTSAAATAFNNHYLPRGHPMVTPMVCGITDPFSGTAIVGSNEYSAELTAEYSTTFATDDDGPGNHADVGGPTPSDFAKIMKHYELLRNFEEYNAKVQNGNSCTNIEEYNDVDKSSSKSRETVHNTRDEISNYLPQIRGAHLLRKIGKFSVSSQSSTSNIEPKLKNAEQQTEAIQQRNVSQQTFPYCCNEENTEIDEPFIHHDVKRRKTCDCRLLDNNKRYATVESMRLPIQKINLKGVAGLSDVKIIIRETFLLPLTHPQLFQLYPATVRRCSRCLLYGPPGTGKTLLAQAIASELQAGLYYVSCAGILSCFIGESEKNVKELFDHALEQREASVIFFDEIDSVCRKRSEAESEHSRRLKTELLRYFENPALEESQVYVLSATNCPWDLDPAFLRRFQRHIYIPLPDREARQQIIAQQLSGLRVLLCEDDWDQILNQTEGFSGSDLTNFVSIAVAQPNREILRATHWRCFDVLHQADRTMTLSSSTSEVQELDMLIAHYYICSLFYKHGVA